MKLFDVLVWLAAIFVAYMFLFRPLYALIGALAS